MTMKRVNHLCGPSHLSSLLSSPFRAAVQTYTVHIPTIYLTNTQLRYPSAYTAEFRVRISPYLSINMLLRTCLQINPPLAFPCNLFPHLNQYNDIKPGVSYRYFTQKKATAYGVTGWVRNTAQGKVNNNKESQQPNPKQSR
jgi:hypothetical protein